MVPNYFFCLLIRLSGWVTFRGCLLLDLLKYESSRHFRSPLVKEAQWVVIVISFFHTSALLLICKPCVSPFKNVKYTPKIFTNSVYCPNLASMCANTKNKKMKENKSFFYSFVNTQVREHKPISHSLSWAFPRLVRKTSGPASSLAELYRPCKACSLILCSPRFPFHSSVLVFLRLCGVKRTQSWTF